MKPHIYNKIPFSLGLFSVVVFYFPILSQKFWMLDDHNFVFWYYQEDGNFFRRFVSFLFETNFSDYPNGARFTPTLDFFFAIRTALLPNNPIYWYALNFIIALSIYTLIYLNFKHYMYQKASNILILNFAAALISSFSLCNSVGARVLGRLGTGETYAILFFVCGLYCLQRILVTPGMKTLWILLIVSQGLLIGSKENYFWIPCFFAILIIARLKETKKEFSGLLFTYLGTTFFQVLLLILGILPSLLKTNSDIYGNSTSVTSSLQAIYGLFPLRYSQIFLVTLFVITFLSHLHRIHSSIFALTIMATLFIFIDQVYYRGSINDHYLANRVVAFVLLIVALIRVCMNFSWRKFLIPIIVLSLFFAMQFSVFPKGKERLDAHAAATKSFSNGIQSILDSREKHTQFIFVAQSAWDYESIFSVAKHLRANGDNRNFFINLSKDFPIAESSTFDTFYQWAEEGVGENLYSPKALYDSNQQTVCGFSQQKNLKVTQCDRNVIISWLP